MAGPIGSDAFADAPTIGPGVASDPTPADSYTMESGEPNGNVRYRSAWWKFTATKDGWITFDCLATEPASLNNAVLDVFTGSTLTSLSRINASANSTHGSAQAPVQVTNGTTYYVRVGAGGSSDTGMSYVLTVSGYLAPSSEVYTDSPTTAWVQTAIASPSNPGQNYGYYSSGATAADAWAGTGSVSDASTSVETDLDVYSDGSTSWRQVWLTDERPAEVDAGTGSLPQWVYDDPTVQGVVWEPATEASAQRLTVTIDNFQSEAYPDTNGRNAQVKLVQASTIPYAPGFMPASTLNAITSAGEITVSAVSGRASGSVVIDSPNIPLSGDYVFAVALVDPYTATQTTDVADGATHVLFYYSAKLEGQYVPPYRVLRAAPAVTIAPPCRQWGRDDGMAASSARRQYPPPSSRQRSNRRAGGYL